MTATMTSPTTARITFIDQPQWGVTKVKLDDIVVAAIDREDNDTVHFYSGVDHNTRSLVMVALEGV